MKKKASAKASAKDVADVTDGIWQVQKAVLDMLGLKVEDHIVSVQINVGCRGYPTVRVVRELGGDGAGQLRRVEGRYKLVPESA